MWENIILWLIIVLAAASVIRAIYRTVTGKKSGCACSSTACTSCSATDPLTQKSCQNNPNGGVETKSDNKNA
ncbi:MAG: hypothetical protein A2511_00645 [Deltaproteobacteria bacterium RIFOXYD12_FULL_50_9]|nr:MAG: hypothetical protein A2511_00645 [Deltaproteobacteria bacterium RIFOXYD12_FULL_50_9]